MTKLLMPDSLLESASAARASLGDAMSLTLRLLVFDETWQDINDCTSKIADSAYQSDDVFALSTLPVPSFDHPEPFLVPSAAGRHVIGIPLEATGGEVIYAVGKTANGLESLLQAMSYQSAEIRRLREEKKCDVNQLDNFADQVLRDFEERNWLLGLTQHLEICEVTRNLSDVAEVLLPHLKSIVCASSVAFVPERPIGSALKSSYSVVCLHGDPIPGDLSMMEVVRRYRRLATDQPFVRNWPANDNQSQQIPGIQSLMMVAVSRDHEIVGWLLAVNRDVTANIPIRVSADPEDPDFTDNGFGTVEAGLLRTAATVLATHNHNLKMFHANQNLTIGVVKSLANAVDARDKYTHGHSDRVARMGRHLARRLGADPQTCEQILMTGLVHDIGKIGVPDHVLLKPGKLNDEEFEIIKQHPVIGHGILNHIKELSYTLEGVLYHHEAWNGKGYPEGLQGNDIPLFGRILAVVDTYDAMTSNRPYRNGMSFDVAEKIIQEGAGVQWDPSLVAIFLRHRDEFRNICRESPDHCLSLEVLDMDALAHLADSCELKRHSEPVLVN